MRSEHPVSSEMEEEEMLSFYDLSSEMEEEETESSCEMEEEEMFSASDGTCKSEMGNENDNKMKNYDDDEDDDDDKCKSEMGNENDNKMEDYDDDEEEDYDDDDDDDIYDYYEDVDVDADEPGKNPLSLKIREKISSQPPEILEYPISLPSAENLPEAIPDFPSVENLPEAIPDFPSFENQLEAIPDETVEPPSPPTAEAIPDETAEPPSPPTAIISNQTSASTNISEGLQPDLLNQTAADQVISSKKSETSLFQVMKIVSDLQELSFVEKVHIPEDQILCLCNRIVPNAAEIQGPSIGIDFNSLNQLSLPTIGFYGDKRTMGRILKEMGAVDDSIHMQMKEDKLEPGLYVGVMKQYIIVFYWHQGNDLKDASRTQISCNFIRYVVELCDDICVCVEEHNLLEALAAPVVTTSHGPTQTATLQRSHTQNDVTVSSGFNLNIERYISHTPPPEGLVIPKHTLFFAEGYHRCAFLTANYKPARKYLSTQIRKVNANALGFELEQLSKDYYLDFTRLSNDDFVSLLKHSALPEFQSYTELENSFEARRAENRKHNTQYRLTELEEQILKNFLHILPEYCSFVRYLTDSESEEKGHKIPIKKRPFQHLEHQLATILGGKLLFVDSKIKFHQSNGVDLFFIVESSRKPAHPIMFEEEIMLRYAGEGGKTEKASIFPSSKSGPTEKLPVLSGEQLILQCGTNTKSEGRLYVVQVSEVALREWVKSFIPQKLLNLAQNFAFLGFLMSNGILEHMNSFGQPIIDKLLNTEGNLIEKQLLLAFLMSDSSLDKVKNLSSSYMKEFLASGSLDIILAEIESWKLAELSPELQESRLQWQPDFKLDETLSRALFSINTWKDICSSIYIEEKEEFSQNVLSMIRKDMLLQLMKNIESDKAAAEKLQEQQFNKEREFFLTQTKENLSQRRVLGRCGYIESFSVAGSLLRLGALETSLRISSEEEEKPTIQWMIAELAPKKNDLDELTSNSMHCISPYCSDPFELVCCDPDMEDLKMVAFLRSGKLLFYFYDRVHNMLNLYMSPKLGPFLRGSNPIRTFKSGFDLVAFDESTRVLALYDAQLSKVLIYRFDESFRNIDWTGVEIMLKSFSGSTKIIWMQCVPGKAELLLVDDTNRVRVVELHHRPLMKAEHITLSSGFLNACISGDGSFLFVFQTSTANISKAASNFELKVYMLGRAMSFLKNIFLDKVVEDVGDLQMKLVYYGSQIHLVLYSSVVPGYFSSNILNLDLATGPSEFQESEKQNFKYAMEQDYQKTCGTLEYIYHIFDKFAVNPALFRESIRDVKFYVLLKSTDALGEDIGQRKCEEYLTSLIRRLEDERGKDFSNLRIGFRVKMSQSWDLNSIDILFTLGQKPLGNWVRQLICIVPVQIIRAENNRLQPLLDGLQIPPHLIYSDGASLAKLLRFGLYDTVLSQWDGKIKLVSSMGKQGSGKSYLLNQLSGSHFDVAGGKCTSGVWMTVRMDSNCLYILMDFEGLGSFERTEQEDVLLSVLNASLSNITIFNTKDFLLDKETEVIFQRFQSGVSLVKNDEKLFKGLLYIAIKDVDVSDVKELKDKFHRKLLQICERSSENFLTKMYGGLVKLAVMAPFTRREYHQESLCDIASTIEKLGHSYESPRAFLRDLKLVISQIAVKDWSPVDLKRVVMKVDILRRNLVYAVKAGCLSMPGANKMLKNVDFQEGVEDGPIELGGFFIDLQDTGLELAPLDETTSNDKILCQLKSRLESVFERRGKDGDLWHSKFQDFIGALVERRWVRIQKWLSLNTAEFSGSNDVQKLQSEAVLVLAELKLGLSVCGCKCSVCFWRCVLGKGHPSDHSCMGNHVCAEKCTYCSLELNRHQETEVDDCRNLAGHEGNHDCKKKPPHTCVEICSLFEKSSKCSKSCCLGVEHEGTHKCNSPQHMCKMKCSLASCKNPCVIQIEAGDHEKHVCDERYCLKKCIMEGCPRRCGYQDHFHELTSDEHLCGNEHSCPKKCEADGICEIITELVRQRRSFQGIKGLIEYDHVPEQNGLLKDCCIAIPPFKRFHDGGHLHTLNPDAVHYCNVKCQPCGYFCHQTINHSGLHHTVHGNMRNVRFASGEKDVDLQGRMYYWGESGLAEMCNMHCKAQGRGHIHLIHCPMNDNCTSRLYDGSRHETRKYGPDMDVPKDELTHETYWKQMRFKDPCTEEEQKEFALCNHLCGSQEHTKIVGSSSKSYCIEKLWHAPIKRTDSMASSPGHISADGHVFVCEHSKDIPHHVVFVIDRSGSMYDDDIKPSMVKFVSGHNNRLGCVYEGIVRFITFRRRTTTDDSLSVVMFDDSATVALERQEMNEDIVEKLLQYFPGGWTSYSCGLELVEGILQRGSKDPNVEKKKPIVIFMSDGENNCGGDPLQSVNRLKQVEPRMILHTIMYGTEQATLVKMAEIGNGLFHQTLGAGQLAESMEILAISLEPKVAALI